MELARFSIVLGQRLPWPEMLRRALETERLGFDGLFLVDHFYGLKDVDDPTHEAYTMLAALAPFTQRVRLGVMVCGNTYRNPAFLLKQAMTVDHISGGRVDFGVGAGWVEREHEAYGFAFPGAKERVDRFAEALEIWSRLQRQERTTFHGDHYELLDAPFAPKSLQTGGLPVLIGGTGPRMLRLTARHAAIWNAVGSPEEAGAASLRLDTACAAEGRDPATLTRSVSPSINLLASPQAFADGVAAYRAAGIRDIYLPWSRVDAEEGVLREVARDVLPGHRGQSGSGPVRGPIAVVGHRRPRPIDAASAAELFATIGGTLGRRVLDLLIDEPETVLDGAALLARTGAARHCDIAQAFATLGERLQPLGVARPWLEAQRGYRLPAEKAEILRGVRDRGPGTGDVG